MKFDIAVIGSGPGGYVAAIRAAQLGKKVAIIEKADLGGVCLNWGCIPTKALLKSAQVFDYINHAADYGITVKDHKADFEGMVKRSRGVAEGMSKGIAFLMKKNKIEVFTGVGSLADANHIHIKGEKTDETIEAEITGLVEQYQRLGLSVLTDVIIGSPTASPGGRASAGQAYVVFGKTAGTGIDLSAIAAGSMGTMDPSGSRVSTKPPT